MAKVILNVGGMSCSACSSAVEKYLNRQVGVKASVNLVMATASIEYDERIVRVADLERYINESGYTSGGIYNPNAKSQSKFDKTLYISFGVLLLVVLYVCMGSMIGLPLPYAVDMTHSPIRFALLSMILVLPFLYLGRDIFLKGYKTLVHLHPNMDTLVTLGVISSFGYSIYSLVCVCMGDSSAVHQLYFESVAFIIYFIKLGRAIEERGKLKTQDAIRELVEITPPSAFVKRNGNVVEITIDEVVEGDTVVVRAGEKASVDGVILTGSAHIDESFITGESKPNLKGVGDSIVAGALDYDGYIEYRATRIGRHSTVSEIVNLVVEASQGKMSVERIADKVSSIFVPSVIVLALVNFALKLLLNTSIGTAIVSMVTVLVVACPCALGMATPLAVIIGEGLCSSRGILVRKASSIETASQVNTVVFDKTGTLTYGDLKISKVYNYSNMTDNDILSILASIESKSVHPIALAFVKNAVDMRLVTKSISNYQETSGVGIEATIDDVHYLVGGTALLEREGIVAPHDSETLTREGCSLVYLVRDKVILALVGVNDIIRDDAISTIDTLKSRGIEVIMLTGDNETTANIIAKSLHIDRVIAGVLPKDKADVIKSLKASGKVVLMCGDGINDSPSLTEADVGVSMAGGTEVAKCSSDITLMGDKLSRISDLLYLSRKIVGNIKLNLCWAFVYNILMIPIAMGVFAPALVISPMIAGLAMTLSSITVLVSALTLYRYKRS